MTSRRRPRAPRCRPSAALSHAAGEGAGGRVGAGPICAASRRQQQQLHARSPVRGRLRDRPVRPVAAPGAPHLEAGAHRGRDAVSPTPNSRCPTARPAGAHRTWARGTMPRSPGGRTGLLRDPSLLGFLRRQSRATTVLHHTAPRAALYPARVPEAQHSSNPRSRPLRGPGVLKESRQD